MNHRVGNFLGLVVLLQAFSALAQQTPSLQQEGDTWTITQPGIKSRLTPYPEIAYHVGDFVTIDAVGGCVNTGGSGKTWKRYLDPEGVNSARLYHGLIWMPGATLNGKLQPVGTELVRISSTLHKTYLIQASTLPRSELYVRLGYEDDVYSDNSYDKWDPGNPVQCGKVKGQVPIAFVKIKVQRGDADVLSTPAESLPFDLTAKSTDANGLLLNPYWSAQEPFLDSNGNLIRPVPPLTDSNQAAEFLPNADELCGAFPGDTHGFALCKCPNDHAQCTCQKQCTSQDPSFDYPVVLSLNNFPFGLFGKHIKDCPSTRPGGLDGHANWVPVTMTGALTWGGPRSGGVQVFDEDADIYLTKPGGAEGCDWKAYTATWDQHIEVEAASYETLDSFYTSGWDYRFSFHRGEDDLSNPKGTGDRLSSDAVVVGLLGLDCVHECKTELHPIYAIAARIRHSPQFSVSNGEGVLDDYWAVFARNWGNEGWCSHNDHPLDLQRVSLTLSAPKDATSFEVIPSPTDYSNPSHQAGQHTRVDDPNTEFKGNVPGIMVGGPELDPIRKEARIAILFPDGETHATVNGLLHIRWHGQLQQSDTAASDDPPENDCGGYQGTPHGDGEQSIAGKSPDSFTGSRQAAQNEKVTVVSYSEIMGVPLSNPSREAILGSDKGNQLNFKTQKKLLKENCPTGQKCKEPD